LILWSVLIIMYREDRGGVVIWRQKCWHNSQKKLGPKIVGKSRPFREILVMPRERGWAGGGECDKRASKILFKPIARINLFISNVMHAAHSCSPRFTKVTFPPASLKWMLEKFALFEKFWWCLQVEFGPGEENVKKGRRRPSLNQYHGSICL
jgi:hypothetical protein